MKKSNFVGKIRVAQPCSQRWEEMIGNDQVRFCTHCAKDVNNISSMSRKDALRLVRRSQGRLCIRYVKHPETQQPIFANQFVPLTRRAPRVASGVMSAAITLAGFSYAQQGASKPAPATNKVARPDASKEAQNPGPLQVIRPSSIKGTITDENGAVIPGVKVNLLNANGESLKELLTNDEGNYSFGDLKSGNYSVATSMRFFKNSLTTNIELKDGSEQVIDVALPIEGDMIVVGDLAVSEPDHQGKLAIAVANDDISVARSLLAAGADVNGREDDRTTPLFIAVEHGNREMVQLLLDYDAKVNARNDEKESALMKVDEDASRELIEMLIRAGAKVNVATKSGNTALILAAENSTEEVVRALIDAGAEVDKKNEDGVTALMKAADSEDIDKVRALVFAGADVNIRDNDGDNAWDYTATDEIEGFLVAHGAVVDPEDMAGRSHVEMPIVDY